MGSPCFRDVAKSRPEGSQSRDEAICPAPGAGSLHLLTVGAPCGCQ